MKTQKEKKYTFAWFKRFFMPYLDMDVDPETIMYDADKNAKACWKHFVRPQVQFARLSLLTELEEELKDEVEMLPWGLKGLSGAYWKNQERQRIRELITKLKESNV